MKKSSAADPKPAKSSSATNSPTSSRTVVEPYTILDLHNGRFDDANATGITKLLWISDADYGDGFDAFFSSVLKPPTLPPVDFYVAYTTAVMRNDNRALQILYLFETFHPDQRDWIAVLKSYSGAWRDYLDIDTESLDRYLENHPDPFFRALVWKKKAIAMSKRRDVNRNNPDIDHKRELEEILALFRNSLVVFKTTSAFETGRVHKEIADLYSKDPDGNAEKVELEQAWQCLTQCRHGHLLFRLRERLTKIQDSRFQNRSESRVTAQAGQIIERYDRISNIKEFAEVTIDLLTESSQVQAPFAQFFHLDENGDEVVLARSKEDAGFVDPQFYEVDLNYGYCLRVYKAVHRRLLEVFLRDIRARLDDWVKFDPRIKLTTPLPYRFGQLEFNDYGYEDMWEKLGQALLSPVEVPLLILGPTGVGKTAVARQFMPRPGVRDATFQDMNCAEIGIDGQSKVSEIFGWTKGSFTTALSDTESVFELAGNGVMFFDEAGSLGDDLQRRFLKVIEERTYNRLGQKRIKRDVHCRLIFATNEPILEKIKKGEKHSFRQDFWSRLSSMVVNIPKLNDVPRQILFLAEKFADGLRLSPNAREYLQSIEWDENIRMLKHCMDSTVRLARSKSLDVVTPELIEKAYGDRMKQDNRWSEKKRVLLSKLMVEEVADSLDMPPETPGAENATDRRTTSEAAEMPESPGSTPIAASHRSDFHNLFATIFGKFERNGAKRLNRNRYFSRLDQTTITNCLRHNAVPIPKRFGSIFDSLTASPYVQTEEDHAEVLSLAHRYRVLHPEWRIPSRFSRRGRSAGDLIMT